MKILLTLALLASAAGHAATPTIPTAAFQTAINKYLTPANALKYSLGTVIRQSHRAICQYSFAIQGGATTTVNLKQLDGVSNCTLPTKAIIWDGLIDTVTAITSVGSPTIAIGANTTTDLKGATASASYSGVTAIVPVGTAATAVKLTAERTITATIAASAVSAGKFRVFLDYVLSE